LVGNRLGHDAAPNPGALWLLPARRSRSAAGRGTSNRNGGFLRPAKWAQ
jgi:hypothetical protein